MIEDGRAFGTVLVLKHLLAALNRKDLITHAERERILDDARAELEKSSDALTQEAKHEAGRAIGYSRHL